MSDVAGLAQFTRRLPHNVDAEMALLGAILVDNRAYERVVDFLLPEHFIISDHQKIFAAIVQVIGSGRVADPVTLKTHFENDDDLTAIGGVAYLIKLADHSVTSHNAADYGRLIRDLHTRRELIALGEDLVNKAYDGKSGSAASEIINEAEDSLFDLSRGCGAADRSEPKTIYEAVENAYTLAVKAAEARSRGTLPGIATGIRDIDDLTFGLHRGELTIIAGRPGAGKTEIAANIARNVAMSYRRRDVGVGKTVQDGGRVLFFSLEMQAHQLGERIQARASKISGYALRGGRMPVVDVVMAWHDTKGAFRGVPLTIDDTPGLSVASVRAKALTAKRKGGLDLIVIDYLQLMSPPSGMERASEAAKLEAMTRNLKAMAKEVDVPVICLSQLNRGVESRDDKRPQLHDLRNSGAIEQDADNVAFVYRESYYLERSEPVQRQGEAQDKFFQRHADWTERCERAKNVMELSYAKQRMGPIRTVKLFCDLQMSFIGDLEKEGCA